MSTNPGAAIGPRAIPGSQQLRPREGAQADSALEEHSDALRAEDGSRSAPWRPSGTLTVVPGCSRAMSRGSLTGRDRNHSCFSHRMDELLHRVGVAAEQFRSIRTIHNEVRDGSATCFQEFL